MTEQATTRRGDMAGRGATTRRRIRGVAAVAGVLALVLLYLAPIPDMPVAAVKGMILLAAAVYLGRALSRASAARRN